MRDSKDILLEQVLLNQAEIFNLLGALSQRLTSQVPTIKSYLVYKAKETESAPEIEKVNWEVGTGSFSEPLGS